jgi:hypothetical protein
MKISELIQELEEVKKNHGDIYVKVDGYDGEYHLDYLTLQYPFAPRSPSGEDKTKPPIAVKLS